MNITNSGTCTPATVKVHRCVSVLPNDYSVMENLPKINGVTLLGEMTSKQLNLLSSKADDYETKTVEDVKEKYIMVLGEAGEEAQKVKVSDFLSQASGGDGGSTETSGFATTSSIDEETAVGTYLFVEKN